MFTSTACALVSLFLPLQPAMAFIGGRTPSLGDFTSAVSLEVQGDGFCTGVMISPTHILTAANCVTSMRKVFDQMNELSLNNNSVVDQSWLRQVSAQIKSIYVHPSWPLDFNETDAASVKKYREQLGQFSDVAVIELATPVDIPVAAIAGQMPAKGEPIYVGGFGCRSDKVEDSGKLTMAAKKIATVDTNSFVSLALNPYGKASSQFCDGDSGGPVYSVSSTDHSLTVVGINSFSLPGDFSLVNSLTRIDVGAGAPRVGNWLQSVLHGMSIAWVSYPAAGENKRENKIEKKMKSVGPELKLKLARGSLPLKKVVTAEHHSEDFDAVSARVSEVLTGE